MANTWGAKGVFRWDSPHHMGTAGLQAHDFELLGFAELDEIVAIGIDPDESPPDRFALARVTELSPRALDSLPAPHRPAAEPLGTNALYARLSAVAQPGYVSDRFPMHPARVISDLSATLGDLGLVAADPGWVGLWVARTFPTTALGSVVVPASGPPGIAAALAFVASRRGRPAIAVTDTTGSTTGAHTGAVLDVARRHGVDLVVSAWGADSPIATAADHLAAVETALDTPGVSLVATPVDERCTDLLVDAAGEVVAWNAGG